MAQESMCVTAKLHSALCGCPLPTWPTAGKEGEPPDGGHVYAERVQCRHPEI